jgi:hypothetical protein
MHPDRPLGLGGAGQYEPRVDHLGERDQAAKQHECDTQSETRLHQK